MTIEELLAATGLTANDLVPIYDAEAAQNVEPTQKVTAAQLAAAVKVLANLQDKLTFDSTPTAGSTNPVTSGGIATAIQQSTAFISDGALTKIADLTSGQNYTYTATVNGLYMVAAYTGNISGELVGRIQIGNNTMQSIDSMQIGAYASITTGLCPIKAGTTIKALAVYPNGGAGTLYRVS